MLQRYFRARSRNESFIEDLFDDDKGYRRRRRLRVLALVIEGVLHRRQQKIDRRNLHRTYLTRADLNPNPRFGTAWQHLYARRDDRAYITTMGIDVTTFEYILGAGFAHTWDTNPIPRNDVESTGVPRIDRRSLDAAGALGLVLHYLSSTMREISLQQIFGLVPTTATRYLKFSLTNLLATLRELPDASIKWPREEEFEDLTRLIVERHPRLWGVFGFIDGLKLPVQESSNDEIENATYNGWLHIHAINNMLVFVPDGKNTLQISQIKLSSNTRYYNCMPVELSRKLARLACRAQHLRKAADAHTRRFLFSCRYSVPSRRTLAGRLYPDTNEEW
jgi:hypothetical protein